MGRPMGLNQFRGSPMRELVGRFQTHGLCPMGQNTSHWTQPIGRSMGLSLSHGTPHERTHETCRSRGTCSVPLDTTHELENVPRVLSWGVPWDEFSLMARPIDVHMTVPMGCVLFHGSSLGSTKGQYERRGHNHANAARERERDEEEVR